MLILNGRQSKQILDVIFWVEQVKARRIIVGNKEKKIPHSESDLSEKVAKMSFLLSISPRNFFAFLDNVLSINVYPF